MNRADVAETWRGRWALVTGASSGIGAAIAEELAAMGVDLILTSRRLDRLGDLASSLRRRHGVRTRVVQADLRDPTAPAAIHDVVVTEGLDVEILVNNAGLIHYGEFHSSDLANQLAMVQVHCAAVVHLTHLFAQGMIQRKRGHILVVASTTLAPAAYISTYAATKGFDLLFAEGLAEELDHHGVRVTALCPGPTRSEMLGQPDDGVQHKAIQSATAVARAAVRGLAGGRRYVRPSLSAWLTANAPRFLPRATVSGAMERFYRPKHLREPA